MKGDEFTENIIKPLRYYVKHYSVKSDFEYLHSVCQSTSL